MSRCTGHCCEEFYIPLDVVARIRTRDPLIGDVEMLASMLRLARYAGPGDVMPSGEVVDDGQHAAIWTCIHFDRETRDCTVYDHRPKMCSDYPYERKCRVIGCTFQSEDDGRRRLELLQ